MQRVSDVCSDEINFTHRAAFGEIGEGDKHGSLKQLAEDTV
jgi:hypothetical protein